ncbi:MAG: hypothetical protein PHV83_06835, partial [Bacteroidales bacterium]|nr:hypothetical protein [Bacteroidales bacterium]
MFKTIISNKQVKFIVSLAFAVMMQMQDEVLAELMEGNPVSLGKLVNLTLVFRARTVNTLEDANEKTITRKYLRNTPSIELRDGVKSFS